MKTTKAFIALATGALLMPFATAQEVIREPSFAPAAGAVPAVNRAPSVDGIQVAGNIAGFSDNSIALQIQTTAAPVQYRYSNNTQWVDETGHVLARESVRTGVPVTLYYTRSADGLLVSKVVVRQTAQVAAAPSAGSTVPADAVAAATAEPMQVAGTIAQFGDSSIALRTKAGAGSVQYRYSNATQWVDEAGNVVSSEKVRTGLPVTLYYTRAADGLLVSKAVVRRQASTVAVDRPAIQAVQAAPTAIESREIAAQRESGAISGDTTVQRNAPVVTERRKAVVKERPAPRVTERREIIGQEPPAARGTERREAVVEEQPAPRVIERRDAIIEEQPAPRVTERRKATVEERPAPKVSKKRKPVVVERPEPIAERPSSIQAPVPRVIEETTTTTTRRKADDDDDDD